MTIPDLAAEHSHRSEIANTIINEAKANLATFLDILDDYEILFTQGGGTGEFSATAYNLIGTWVANKREEIFSQPREENSELPSQMQLLNDAVNNDLKLDYIITGSWSAKAAAEAARLFGQDKANVAVDARLSNNGKLSIIHDESTWKPMRAPGSFPRMLLSFTIATTKPSTEWNLLGSPRFWLLAPVPC